MDEVLDEVDQYSENDESEELPPPKKKRRIEKEKKSKRKEKEEEPIEKEVDEQDLLKRKELKIIMLKNPTVDTSKIEKIGDDINRMSKEEVSATLEAMKLQIGLQSPISASQNMVHLGASLIQRWYGSKGLSKRIREDTQLLAAVDQYVPNLADYIVGPLQIVTRLVGHVTDEQYEQNNYGPEKENIPFKE